MTMINLWPKDRGLDKHTHTEAKKNESENNKVETAKVIGPNQKSHREKKMKKKDYTKNTKQRYDLSTCKN